MSDLTSTVAFLAKELSLGARIAVVRVIGKLKAIIMAGAFMVGYKSDPICCLRIQLTSNSSSPQCALRLLIDDEGLYLLTV